MCFSTSLTQKSKNLPEIMRKYDDKIKPLYTCHKIKANYSVK